MARQPNPRRVAYAAIRNMRAIATAMAGDWQGPRKKVDRSSGTPRWVTAPPEEQPENNIADWSQLAKDAASVARWAEHIRFHAEQQMVELRMKRGDL